MKLFQIGSAFVLIAIVGGIIVAAGTYFDHLPLARVGALVVAIAVIIGGVAVLAGVLLNIKGATIDGLKNFPTMQRLVRRRWVELVSKKDAGGKK